MTNFFSVRLAKYFGLSFKKIGNLFLIISLRTKKHNFLTGVAFILPDHWACAFCYKLHRVQKDDIPWQERHNYCSYDHDKRGARFAPFFEIQERHVRLALKLTQLKTTNQGYLKKIMSPFAYKRTYANRLFITLARSMYFQATPKVITERLLLYIQWEMIYDDGPLIRRLDRTRVCPHMQVGSIGGPLSQFSGPKNFGNDVRLALTQPGNEVNGHCPRCPIDYSIIAGPHPNRITIHAWYDFGSYKSPNNAFWTIHVMSD